MYISAKRVEDESEGGTVMREVVSRTLNESTFFYGVKVKCNFC